MRETKESFVRNQKISLNNLFTLSLQSIQLYFLLFLYKSQMCYFKCNWLGYGITGLLLWFTFQYTFLTLSLYILYFGCKKKCLTAICHWFFNSLLSTLSFEFSTYKISVLFHSPLKVLFSFRSRYLFSIGPLLIFRIRRNIPPALNSNLKEFDSKSLTMFLWSIIVFHHKQTGLSPFLILFSNKI